MLLNSNQYIQVEQLAKVFSVSKRTIWNDINEIDDLLESNNYDAIKSVRKEGFILELDDIERNKIKKIIGRKIENLYFDSNNRIFNLLLEFTFSSSPIILKEKQDEFKVSKTTLDNDMKDIRSILESYNLSVISKAKMGMCLEGSEHLIRLMIHDIINKYVNNLSLFQEIPPDSLAHTILYNFISQECFRKARLTFDYHFKNNYEPLYLEQIILFSLIWALRVNNNNMIDNDVTSEIGKHLNKNLIGYINELDTELSLASEETEKKYLYNFLNIISKEKNEWNTDWGTAQIFTFQLIDEVDSKINLSYSNVSNDLFEGLFNHILSLIPRLRNDIQMYNPLTENIKDNFSKLFKIIKHFVGTTIYLESVMLTDDEVAFLCIHFLTALSKTEQEYKLTYKALVFCNYGIATGELLKEKLQQYFDVDVIAVLNTNEMYLADKLDVDIIFSTTTIGKTTKPSLIVNPIFTNTTIRQIEVFLQNNEYLARKVPRKTEQINQYLFNKIIDAIKNNYETISENMFNDLLEIFNENKLDIDLKELLPMIEDVIVDDSILLNVEVTTWQEAIEVVAKPLLKNNIIEERYIDAMITSVNENGPYIVIGNSIALAHARPEDGVNELGLSAATLNPPIEFGNDHNDPVKIIFCLAAVDSHSHLNIMKSLANIIIDENRVNELINSSTNEEFKKVFFEK